MTINYVDITYHPTIYTKTFPLEKKETKLICLDSFQFNNLHGKEFDDSENMIRDYVNREYNSSNKSGVYWNWVITLDGKIYKMTPNKQAAHCCVFQYYSERISKDLPEYCPQYKIDTEDFTKTPDQVIESICLETKPSAEDLDLQPTKEQRNSLIDLLAYLLKENNLKTFNIITRSMIAKIDNLKKSLGHQFYKNHISELVIIASYAMMQIKKESEIGIKPYPTSIVID